jgi:hypothetical protein
MAYRKYPLPPIEKFRQGAVWRVTLEETNADAPRKNYEDVVRDHSNCEVLVLLTAPWRAWPPHKGYYWRSRLLVGDLRRREPIDVLRDFRKLLLQTPPVLRNWHKDLEMGTFEGRRRHLVWESEIDLIAI